MTKILKRNPSKGYLGGVAEGLGKWSGIPAIIWRVLFLFVAPMHIVYLVMWAFLEEE